MALSGTTAFASDICGLQVTSSVKSDVSYKERGGYCEGLFLQDFSTFDEVEILGFHASAIEDQPRSDERAIVTIRTDAVAGGQLLIRDLVPSKFYQFDKPFSQSELSFEWDLRVISDSRVNLDFNDIAVMACLKSCQDFSPRLLPVEIKTRSMSEGMPPPYILYDLPLATERVTVTISSEDGNNVIDELTLAKPALFPAIVQKYELPPMAHNSPSRIDIVAYLGDGTPSYATAVLEAVQ